MKLKIIKKSADKNVDNSIVFKVAIHKGEGEVIRKKAIQALRDTLISVLKHNDDYVKSNIILADSVNNPEVYKDFIEAGEKDGCYFEFMEIIFTENSMTTSDGLDKVLKTAANNLVEKYHVGICTMTSDRSYYCIYKLYDALRKDFDKEYMEMKETIDGDDSHSIHESDVDIRIQVSCPNPEIRRKATEFIRSKIHNGLKGNSEYINSDIVLTDSLQYPSQYPTKDDKTEIVEVVMAPSILTTRTDIIYIISNAIFKCRLNNPILINVETNNLPVAFKRILLHRAHFPFSWRE